MHVYIKNIAQKVSEVPNVPCVQAKTDGTDNVMDMCESTNLAAEEETTGIEPKIPVCEAQVDRVSCISQSALSHSLNMLQPKRYQKYLTFPVFKPRRMALTVS